MTRLMPFPLLVALVLGSALTPASAAGQTTERSITLIIPEGYPAFGDSIRRAHPEARELSALLLVPDTSARWKSTVLLLNPAHVNPGRLRHALLTARSHRERAITEGWFIPLLVESNPPPVPPGQERLLAQIIQQLTQRPVEEIRDTRAKRGRVLTVARLSDLFEGS